MKQTLLFTLGVIATLAAQAITGHGTPLFLTLLGASLPIAILCVWLASSKRLRKSADVLQRAANGLDAFLKPGKLTLVSRIGTGTASAVVDITKELTSALCNLGMPKAKADHVAHSVILANPGASLDELIRVAVRRAA